MGLPHWNMDEIDYSRIDRGAINGTLLAVVKAAALVEYNAVSYSEYLERVFADDPAFQEMSRCWATEEVQHGRSLGKWAETVDPNWKLEEAMARFRAGYQIEHLGSTESIRGSRAGEMVARCMVETGTSSYYTAIGTSIEEPVLKEICAKIAGDEFRHYKLFYDTLNRYLKIEGMTRFGRLKVALSRIAESEDDELSYAFFAANAAPDELYDRKIWGRKYLKSAYSYYQAPQVDRAVAMVFKACGFDPKGMGGKIVGKAAWWLIRKNVANNNAEVAAAA